MPRVKFLEAVQLSRRGVAKPGEVHDVHPSLVDHLVSCGRAVLPIGQKAGSEIWPDTASPADP